MQTKYLKADAVRESFDAGLSYDDITIAIADELADLESEYETAELMNNILCLIDEYNKHHNDQLSLTKTTTNVARGNEYIYANTNSKCDADDEAIKRFLKR